MNLLRKTILEHQITSKTMRMAVVLILCNLLSLHTTVFSQSRVTLKGENIPLKSALEQVEQNAKVKLVYSDENIRNFKVSFDFKNATVQETLNDLLKNTGNVYQILDNNLIVISPAGVAQDNTVTGMVIDADGYPLPGASVTVKGASQGTATDANGAYALQVSNNNATLVFSYIGFVTQEVVVGSQRIINVTMGENTRQIDEVVVVGYGTQKKVNLTAAISSINAQEIQTTTSTSSALKLQGKVAGLNIRQNTGEPGRFDNSINIRGFGSPLYVIDGIQRPAEVFQKMNGADIEDVTILKDAAAAIYGMNAANGVVIVTTKQGKNEKTNFRFSSTVGFATPTDVPRMCNAYEYMTLRNEAAVNMGLLPFITKDEMEKWKSGGPGYEGTDWYGATFNNYSMRQEHNLSGSGGTDRVNYYFNLGGAYDNSMLKTGDMFYKRISFRSNMTARLTDHIKAVANIGVVNDTRESPVSGFFDIWRGTVASTPVKKVYANDNPLYLNRVQDGQSMNPVAMSSSDLTGYTRDNDNGYFTSLELTCDVPFIPGLQMKALASYDRTYYMGKGVNKKFSMYDYDVTTDTYVATNFYDPSWITNGYTNVYYTTIRGQADYRKAIKNHNFSAMFVYEVRDAAARWANIQKYFDFFTNDQIDQASNTNAQSGGNEWQQRYVSYIGRANYDYKGRYLIEFAGRYDGSYRYHPDQRWGFFPLMSAGWRVSDEKFMEPFTSVLSNMKLRVSYGKIGEDAGNPFQYAPGFTTGGGWWEFTEGRTTLGLNTPAIVNEKLTWMTSELIDIGIDMSFFKHKLEVTFDWYRKNRSGLLAYRNVSLPNTYGGTFPQENLNKDRVQGFDFAINYKNAIGEVKYKVSGIFNYATRTVKYIEQGNFANSWDIYRWDQTGRYQDVVWNYKVIGQYQSEEDILAGAIIGGNQGNRYAMPGDFIYEDANGDGVIDGNDIRPHFYNASPRMNYGMSLDVLWKGFDAHVQFQGAALYSAMFENAYTTMFWAEANVPAYFLDRWHREDPYDPESAWIPGKWPAARTTDHPSNTYIDSDAWRKDCSFVRLKNIVAGYTLPQRYTLKAGLTSVRFFANVNNVYTWADNYIKPFDPEKVMGSYNTGWVYPLMKTWNFGLDINF